ncbi:MAG: stalk domain-containing protein [Caldiserica bacterium]|nr:stalk domain-containing protein [Caldisericota bacterium]
MVQRIRMRDIVRGCLVVVVAVLLTLPAGVLAVQPAIDGVVKAGEYEHSTMLGDGIYTLSWTVAGDTAWFGIQATTTGWVALGIDPETIMKGADMVFGWVSGGKTTVLDQYSTGMDTQDKAIPASGSLKIIWAIGNADSVSPHSRKGSATIDIGAPAPIVLTFTIGSKNGTRNGTPVTLDAAPVIQNGRTLLPVRYVAEPLGATVTWTAGTRTVTVQRAGLTLALVVGRATAVVNGGNIRIDPADARVVPIILQGRTMLPARFVAEQLGCAVSYDPTTRVVTITYPKP